LKLEVGSVEPEVADTTIDDDHETRPLLLLGRLLEHPTFRVVDCGAARQQQTEDLTSSTECRFGIKQKSSKV